VPPEERWENVKARAAELEALGATKVRDVDEGAMGRWVVMQDPEGNEFCVT
jgi:predicted enzyme related to lactoylglutathione lyase